MCVIEVVITKLILGQCVDSVEMKSPYLFVRKLVNKLKVID